MKENRTHPHDPHISNGRLASWLIWLSRKRVPGLFRLYSAYLNCDLGRSLPVSIFLPHPYGIILADGEVIGDDAVIGANAVITKDVPAGAKVVNINRILK